MRAFGKPPGLPHRWDNERRWPCMDAIEQCSYGDNVASMARGVRIEFQACDAIVPLVCGRVSTSDLQRPVEASETPTVGQQRPRRAESFGPRAGNLFECRRPGRDLGMPPTT